LGENPQVKFAPTLDAVDERRVHLLLEGHTGFDRQAAGVKQFTLQVERHAEWSYPVSRRRAFA
jgi:hypothetical protein